MTNMILSGDVGGTKTRLALFQMERGSFSCKDVETFDSKSAGSLDELVQRFLSPRGVTVQAACLGIPGPVVQGRVRVTNLPWEFSENELEQKLHITRIKLVNDLVSYTAAIPHLQSSDIETIHPGNPSSESTLSCIIGVGTGLGMGFLHTIDGVGHPIASEGGHANVAPNSEIEVELFRYLKSEFPLSVSWERVLCGPGLFNIYNYLKTIPNNHESEEVKSRLASENPGAVITQCALEGRDRLCQQTLDIFVSLLGSHASNLVLTFLATGGVYLSGGVSPKILPKLRDGTFIKAYLSKQRLREVIERTPVHVIKDDKVALLGAASLAAREIR